MDPVHFETFVEETKKCVKRTSYFEEGTWTQHQINDAFTRDMWQHPHTAWSILAGLTGFGKQSDSEIWLKKYHSYMVDYAENLKAVRTFYVCGGVEPDLEFAKLILPQELFDDIKTKGAAGGLFRSY